MAAHQKLLAFDLGAESGRGVLGLFDGRELRLEVVHRFPNGGVRTLDTLHWDVLRLYGEMLQTLRICAADFGTIDGLGVDTWGVDYALLGRDGTLLGPLRASVAADTGLNAAPVIAPASHDTGSAVAAVPASAQTWAYISSGTWSLMGVELTRPLLSEAAMGYNFTNEGGVGGTVR